MTWFTETPWPPIIILAIAAIACLVAWASQKRGFWLVAGLLAIVAAVAVYLIERAVVTEAERVEQSVHALATAFQRKDRDGTLSFISVQAPELRTQVEQALAWVDLPNGIDIKDMRKSEVAWRPLLRAFTAPASWIAPENSNSFSLSVVLPASG